MRFAAFEVGGQRGLAVEVRGELRGMLQRDVSFPVALETLIASGDEALRDAAMQLERAPLIDPAARLLPPLVRPPKIICIGLNYADHTAETKLDQPQHPTLFLRTSGSLVAHGQPIVRPYSSEELDFEGEMAAVIGRGGRRISREQALEHVFGWSIFNEATVRDVQFRTQQWTLGKNFDSTGAFGPRLIAADEVPLGGRGLRIETRLNGEVVQSANTSDMIFDVAAQIAAISEAMTLEPGDVLVTGTPAGCGKWRTPQLWMKHGDVVEVEVEGLGVLTNPVVDEIRPA